MVPADLDGQPAQSRREFLAGPDRVIDHEVNVQFVGVHLVKVVNFGEADARLVCIAAFQYIGMDPRAGGP